MVLFGKIFNSSKLIYLKIGNSKLIVVINFIFTHI